MSKAFTAACCIIGDEILNGNTLDTNSNFLAKFLFSLGIELRSVQVVPDEYDAIANAVREMSKHHNIVFTSGGIGPTHDDITYEAIARAFNLELRVDPATEKRMETMLSKRNIKMGEGHRRLARFPHPAQLIRGDAKLPFPVVLVNNNIYVLPGVPRLFQLLLGTLKQHLLQRVKEVQDGSTAPFYRLQVATRKAETAIAPYLTSIQERLKNQHIKIGSYPVWEKNDQGVSVIVSVVGKDEATVIATRDEIAKNIDGWHHDDPPAKL